MNTRYLILLLILPALSFASLADEQLEGTFYGKDINRDNCKLTITSAQDELPEKYAVITAEASGLGQSGREIYTKPYREALLEAHAESINFFKFANRTTIRFFSISYPEYGPFRPMGFTIIDVNRTSRSRNIIASCILEAQRRR